MATNIEQINTGRHSSRPLNKKMKANEAPTYNTDLMEPQTRSDFKRREIDDSNVANPIFEEDTQVKATPKQKSKRKEIVQKNDENPF